MRRTSRLPWLVLSLAFASCATTSPRGGAPGGLGLRGRGARGAERPQLPGEYSLEKLPLLAQVLLAVKDGYVDPSRIRPREMVVAALERVAAAVDGLTVHGDATSPALTLALGSSSLKIELASVRSIWETRSALARAMTFIAPALAPGRDRQEIEIAAVQGFLSTLDPATQVYREMKLQSRGAQGGIGLVFAMREGKLTIVRVLRDSPAKRAGLSPGDVLTDIDGHATANVELHEPVEWLRGSPGSAVTVTWARAGEEPRRLSIDRQVVPVETVSEESVLEGRIAYVRLFQLSAPELRAAIEGQRRLAGGALRGLVLDLRGSPGGLFEQAVILADVFLAGGEIVRVEGGGERGRILERKTAAAQRDDLADLPLVVLVDSGSASGAEVVVGALKDNGRALVVGQRTVGAGSLQVMSELATFIGTDRVALKLTVARMRRPGGALIEGSGVMPDVVLRPVCRGKDAAPVPASATGFLAVAADAPGETRAPEMHGPALEKPAAELTYVAQGEACGEPAAPVAAPAVDEPVRLAREVLERAASADRVRLLDAARSLAAARGR